MNEDARYIEVPAASGPSSTANTCGGCGGPLTGASHHVFDCLVNLKNRVVFLETHPGVGTPCLHHNHHNHSSDMHVVDGVEFCPICQHGPPW
jgi:hypothetical protein